MDKYDIELRDFAYEIWESNIYTMDDCDCVLEVAKAARAWKDPREFQNGDEIEYYSVIEDRWKGGSTIIGYYPSAQSHFVILANNQLCIVKKENIRCPRKTITYTKKLKETTAWLCDHRYSPDLAGDWYSSDGNKFSAAKLVDCGKPLTPGSDWPSELLEEVEVEESK